MNNKKIMAEMKRLGELPDKWSDKIDPDSIDDDVKEILESDREILEKYRPAEMVRAIEEKRRDGKAAGKAKVYSMMVPVAAAAAALFVLTLLFQPGAVNDQTFAPEDTQRIKGTGEPVIKVYRSIGGETETLASGADAREGDLLQLAYRSILEKPYGIIISLDGRGMVTEHLMPVGGLAEKLSARGEEFLPYSYELDDAPLFETFYLLVSDEPFPVAPLLDLAARKARSGSSFLDFPALIREEKLSGEFGEIEQISLQIKKEEDL